MSGRASPSWPVWIMAIGVILAVGGEAAVAAATGTSLSQWQRLLQPRGFTPKLAALEIAAVFGVFLFAFGIVAYVIRGSSPRRAREGYGQLGTILACLGFAIIVANVATLPFVLALSAAHPGPNVALTPGAIVMSVIALDGSLVGVVYLRIVRPGVLTWRDLGWTSASLRPRVGLGVGIGVGSILISALVELALQRGGVQQTQLEMFSGVEHAPLPQFLGVLIAASVIVPICEETFFRGYVLTAVARERGLSAAVVVSSVLFAVAHTNLAAFLPLLIIGAIFAVVYARTGSLIPTIVAHAMINALALTELYFGPH